jgi:CRP-like cAMP-binding protein
MQEETNVTNSNFWSNLFKIPANKSELIDVLLTMPPFKNLSYKELKVLIKLMHNRCFQPGEVIFSQGDRGIALYIIHDGEVIVERCAENGRKVKLASFSKGDFFGELAMLDDETRSASAIAVRETVLAVIFKPDLDEYIEKYPKKGLKILRGISQIIATRLRNVNEDFVKLYIKESANKTEV